MFCENDNQYSVPNQTLKGNRLQKHFKVVEEINLLKEEILQSMSTLTNSQNQIIISSGMTMKH
ncbi:hypothetical protein C2G38_2056811 [Gigaspora rosea]|uniref:Uncharacterized protein n=1 Tax=Gigaspora rosea TaxID=44941 RepID=A0A397W3S3_9GLOM|nr:hypothetical protein C2G38_2056811 [Gigaspora rosea]